jgi:hypothetical protein
MRLNRGVPFEDTEVIAQVDRGGGFVLLLHRHNRDRSASWEGDEVQEAVDDGLLDPHDWHTSAYDAARSIGAC